MTAPDNDRTLYRELVEALEANPTKRLAFGRLVDNDCGCAVGEVLIHRQDVPRVYAIGCIDDVAFLEEDEDVACQHGLPLEWVKSVFMENDRVVEGEDQSVRYTRMLAWAKAKAEGEAT